MKLTAIVAVLIAGFLVAFFAFGAGVAGENCWGQAQSIGNEHLKIICRTGDAAGMVEHRPENTCRSIGSARNLPSGTIAFVFGVGACDGGATTKAQAFECKRYGASLECRIGSKDIAFQPTSPAP